MSPPSSRRCASGKLMTSARIPMRERSAMASRRTARDERRRRATSTRPRPARTFCRPGCDRTDSLKKNLFGDACLCEQPREECDPSSVGGRRQPVRAHKQQGHGQQEHRDAARDDQALRTRPAKAKMSDGRAALPAQQKPLGRRRCGHDQRANQNPGLPAIAAEDRRRRVKEAEDQEQSQHQSKPVGWPLDAG